jgi:hypothetical protein
MTFRQLWQQFAGKRGAEVRAESEVVILSPYGARYRIKRVRARDGQLFIETEVS